MADEKTDIESCIHVLVLDGKVCAVHLHLENIPAELLSQDAVLHFSLDSIQTRVEFAVSHPQDVAEVYGRSCVDCPRDEHHTPHPERCENRARYDHWPVREYGQLDLTVGGCQVVGDE